MGGVRRAATASVGAEMPHGLPSAVYMGAQAMGRAHRERAAGGVRRGGGGGGGRVASDKDKGDSARAGGDKSKWKSSTLERLWQEAKHEKGYLGMAGVCLLVSSSMNLLAPTVIAKLVRILY